MNNDIQKKVAAFFTAYPQRTYQKGQVILRANVDPQGIFYLTQGNIRQYDISERGDEIVVNVFKPQTFFPMSWALNHTPNDYFFEAATDTTVHIAPASEAVLFVQQNPDVLLDLLSRVYKGTDGLLRRLAHVMGGSAKTRLIFELIVSCRRFGQPTTANAYTLPISEKELASRTGLARETVSRGMQDLKAADLVTISNGKLHIQDLTALEATLGATL